MSEHQSPVPRVEVSLYFDGSVRALKPDGWTTQFGWLGITFGAVRLLAMDTGQKFRGTQNSTLAEWEALQAGLLWVCKLRSLERLVIYGDSRAVIDGVNARNGKSGQHAGQQCVRMLQQLRDLNVPSRASWIPREGNGLADRLSRCTTQTELLEIADKLVPPQAPVRDPSANEHLTRALAERLWRAAGCPHGEDERFWFAAEDFLRAARGS